MKKLIAITIAYKPNFEELQHNIYRNSDGIEKMIIWNNTPNLSNDQLAHNLNLPGNCEVWGDGVNHMISYPINRVIEYAHKHNYTHLLTLDQDSTFPSGEILRYRELLDKYDADIYGATPTGCLVDEFPSDDPLCAPAKHIITSGAIYRMEIFDKLGGFDESYGIDSVDFEMCYRVLLANGKVVMFPTIHLEHQLGYAKKTRFGFTTMNYSSTRLYYIVRNRMWLKRDYPTIITKERIDFLRTTFRKAPFKIILAEDRKLAKLYSILKGYVHGIMHKPKVHKDVKLR